MREESRNRMESTIAALKSVFSMPLRVLYTEPSPPKTELKPPPLLPNRITTINVMESTIWIKWKYVLTFNTS